MSDEKKPATFWIRVISGIVLIAIALCVVGYGGWLLCAVCFLLSMIAMHELYAVLGIERRTLCVIGYCAAIAYYILTWLDKSEYYVFLFIITLMSMLIDYVVTFPECSISDAATAYFGIIYTVVLMSFVYKTRCMHDGGLLVWLIFLSSWGSDTCAYGVGMLIGKHKMSPLVSPHKTWEGSIGGVIGAGILGCIYAFAVGLRMKQVSNPMLACAISCAIGAIISQLGDLAASAIKRNHNAKDYGNLIPGHGGILDRFDSMLFAAPAIYYALTFLPYAR